MNNTAVEQTKTQAMAQKKPITLEEMIKQSMDQLKVALPAGMSAERMARIALTSLRTNPKLYEVAGRNPNSFIAALFQASQLGLEVNTLNEAWLIPYGNEVKFQLGYGGWLKLFYNHQSSVTLQMESVHEKDFFEYDLGASTLSHKPPTFGADRGPVVGYYAIANIQGGGKIIKTMSVKEAKDWAIRYSKCWNKAKEEFLPGTPWASHFSSMAQVTVLKQVLKLVPKSAEMIKKAFAMDESVKTKVEPDMAAVPNEIDYSEKADAAEEVKAEPQNGSEQEPPPEPPPQEAQTLPPDFGVKKYEDFCAQIEKATSRKEINDIFGKAQAAVSGAEMTNQQGQWLLDKMKTRTADIKTGKK